jgi:Na+/melibiose symporter-like transporter
MKLVSWKQVAAAAGMITVCNATKPLVSFFGGGQTGWVFTVSIYGLIMIICLQMMGLSVRRFDLPEKKNDTNGKTKINIFLLFRLVMQNRAMMMLFLAMGTNVMAGATIGQSNIYFFKYWMEGDHFGTYMLITSCVNISAFVLLPFIASKLGKRKTFVIGTLLSMIYPILLAVTQTKSLAFVMILGPLSSFGNMLACALSWSMALDCIDYTYWKSGKRVEAGIIASYTFLCKIGGALGSMIVGFSLQFSGYIPNQPQAKMALYCILFLPIVVPVLSSIASVIAMKYYPITDEVEIEMRKTIYETTHED